MPNREEILAGLTQASNAAAGLAVLWHLVAASALLAVAAGVKLSSRALGALLAAPLASVSVVAWRYGNPFNGTVFGALSVTLVALSFRSPSGGAPRVLVPSSTWTGVAGALVLAFGWLYPHFLVEASGLRYFYAAPMGVIPCPTLSAVIGLTLLAGGVEDRAWSRTLAAAGLFYAVFGIARLGVVLDLGLLAGTIALLVATELGAHAPAQPRGRLV